MRIQQLHLAVIVVLICLFSFGEHAMAYQPKGGYPISGVELPPSVTMYFSQDGKADTSTFGVSEYATECVDSILGELEQPPPPPQGLYGCFLESRCQINGLKYDLHYGSPTAVTVDTFRFKYQLATWNGPLASLRWSRAAVLEYATSATISVVGGGEFGLSANMLQDSVLEWDPSISVIGSLNRVNIYITWKPAGRYSMVAEAGLHGQIFPAGTSIVKYGSDITYTVFPDSGYSVDSLLVDGGMVGSAGQYTFHGVSAGHSVKATFAPAPPITVEQNIAPRWNIVSIPVYLPEYAKTQIYPSAISNAFAYSGSYSVAPNLVPGPGYWIKFSTDQTLSLDGTSCTHAMIPVSAGWNLIGSLSAPLASSAIGVEPPDLVATGLYGFNNGYVSADTLVPGAGYWIKVSKDGFLFLSAEPGAVVSHPIHFQAISDPLPLSK